MIELAAALTLVLTAQGAAGTFDAGDPRDAHDARVTRLIDLQASCAVVRADLEGRSDQGPQLYLSRHWFKAHQSMTLDAYLDAVEWAAQNINGQGFAYLVDQIETDTLQRALHYRDERQPLDCPELGERRRADWPEFAALRRQAIADRQLALSLPPSHPDHIARDPGLSEDIDASRVALAFHEPRRLAVDPDGRHAIEIGRGGNSTIFRRVDNGWERVATMTLVLQH